MHPIRQSGNYRSTTINTDAAKTETLGGHGMNKNGEQHDDSGNDGSSLQVELADEYRRKVITTDK